MNSVTRVAAREPGGWTTWQAARGPRKPGQARRRADLWPGCAPPEAVVRRPVVGQGFPPLV